jgi:peroxiredoxin
MTISTGDKLPEAKFARLGAKGPETVDLSDLTKGRKIVLFAVPGAFTPTCHSAHLPGFMRQKDAIMAKGVDEIICLSVNDVFVMKAWGEATGATAAGITLLSDPVGDFAAALGLAFDGLPVGLVRRSRRYAMVVEDGTVTSMLLEESPGTCEISGAEGILAAL